MNEKEFYEYILVLRNIKKPLYTFSIIESYFENKGYPTKAKNQYGGTTESETLKEDNNDNDSKSYDETLLIKCLKCVDFADVNAEDFKKGPGESKILTFEQKYFILSRLGCSKSIVLN